MFNMVDERLDIHRCINNNEKLSLSTSHDQYYK
jgi:hypothetical protein